MSVIRNQDLVLPRIVLRKFHVGDEMEMFNHWCNDPEVTKFLTWNPHTSISQSKTTLSRWLKDYENDSTTVRYAITLKETGELMGSIDVVHIIDGVPEVGYCIGKKYWGHGYMTEVCNAFVDHLFALGYKKVTIRADIHNIGSNRVIQKCGFHFVRTEYLEHNSPFKSEPVTLNCYEKDNL